MRNFCVFLLWLFAMVFSFIFLFGIWMVCVTLPRMLWHMYRNSTPHDIKEWEMPYYPLQLLSEKIRKLHRDETVISNHKISNNLVE